MEIWILGGIQKMMSYKTVSWLYQELYEIVQIYLDHDIIQSMGCVIDCYSVNNNKNWLI